MRVNVVRITENDPASLDDVRVLLSAYNDWLGPAVRASALAEEMASLPHPYTPPAGALFLARDDTGRAVGCVGLRGHDVTTCEIKRLYVREDARGHGIGRVLVRAGMDHARAVGFARMVLTTLPDRMQSAVTMYRSLGFEDTEPFADFSNVSPGFQIAYMARAL